MQFLLAVILLSSATTITPAVVVKDQPTGSGAEEPEGGGDPDPDESPAVTPGSPVRRATEVCAAAGRHLQVATPSTAQSSMAMASSSSSVMSATKKPRGDDDPASPRSNAATAASPRSTAPTESLGDCEDRDKPRSRSRSRSPYIDSRDRLVLPTFSYGVFFTDGGSKDAQPIEADDSPPIEIDESPPPIEITDDSQAGQESESDMDEAEALAVLSQEIEKSSQD